MKRAAPLLCASLALLLAPTLRADSAELQGQLRCERAAGPGRILCELTIDAPLGKLVWSDALVVRAPAFARPLRSRFVAQLGTAAGAEVGWAKFALVASESGQGQLELLARGVVCHRSAAGEWCAPRVVSVTAQVEVTPPSAPGR